MNLSLRMILEEIVRKPPAQGPWTIEHIAQYGHVRQRMQIALRRDDGGYFISCPLRLPHSITERMIISPPR
jgi:hypothetical protein